MRADLLLAVADHLDTVPDEIFIMEDWSVETNCGFAGCAIGHAAHAEIVPGLRLDLIDRQNVRDPYTEVAYTTEGRRGCSDWEAVAAAFGLSLPEAFHLFDGDEYGIPTPDITPQMVAARIRDFVAGSAS